MLARRLAELTTSPHLVDERTRRVGQRDSELAAEALAQAVVGGERAGPVARACQASDQCSLGVLRKWIETRTPAGRSDRAGSVAVGFGPRGHAFEQVGERISVQVAMLVHPLLVEPGEQLAATQRQRLLKCPGRHVLPERRGVNPHLRRPGEPHSVARGDERAVGLVRQRSPQRPECVAQARPCARVEHVRPEPRRHPASRVRARIEGEPGQQRTRTP